MRWDYIEVLSYKIELDLNDSSERVVFHVNTNEGEKDIGFYQLPVESLAPDAKIFKGDATANELSHGNKQAYVFLMMFARIALKLPTNISFN